MPQILPDAFIKYPCQKAPFLHRQYSQWTTDKPLRGLRILQHVPLVQNTLLKIACLVTAGADVTVTNPNFMKPCSIAIQRLNEANIPFVSDLNQLKQKSFDIYLDCGAELFQTLGTPRLGAVELTGSGDQFYRESNPTFPVISIDRSLTKQLETVFGMAVSAIHSLEKITHQTIRNKKWMIFGFGKIGRGLAYSSMQHQAEVTVADISEAAKSKASQLKIHYIDAHDRHAVEIALKKADIVITATGKHAALSAYPKEWFIGKMLANMGILDEYGPSFQINEVLNHKKPLNFILDDPTPIEYIDPALYAHNEVILNLLNRQTQSGVHDMEKQLDEKIIKQWCHDHRVIIDDIDNWFINMKQH